MYEYSVYERCHVGGNLRRLEEVLTSKSQEGWELDRSISGNSTTLFIFRRPVQKPSPIEVTQAFEDMLKDNDEYAWEFHLDLAETLSCSFTPRTLKECNQDAALVLKSMFDIDVTQWSLYQRLISGLPLEDTCVEDTCALASSLTTRNGFPYERDSYPIPYMQALEAVLYHMRKDDGLVWAWQHSMAKCIQEKTSYNHSSSHVIAADLMKVLFDIDVTRCPLYHDTQEQ